MRLFASLLVLVSYLVISIGGPSRTTNAAEVRVDDAQAALEVLKAQQGKDLRKLDEDKEKEVLRAITRLVPKRTYQAFFDFHPWYFREFKKTEGQPRYLLFEADNSGPHPGYTRIRLTLWDQGGKLQSETTFGTGWRCYLRGVSLLDLAGENYPLIVLETDSWLGPDCAKQYYALIGGRFELVRLENSSGKLTRNNYYVKHFACGPPLPKQAESAWKSDLMSDDRLIVLRGLLWLGGRH